MPILILLNIFLQRKDEGMNIDIKISNKREWKKLEENPQYGTIFHTWEWLKIAERHTDMKLYPIIGIGMKGRDSVRNYIRRNNTLFLVRS